MTTSTPKVCKMMVFRAVLLSQGLLFHILFGFGQFPKFSGSILLALNIRTNNSQRGSSPNQDPIC